MKTIIVPFLAAGLLTGAAAAAFASPGERDHGYSSERHERGEWGHDDRLRHKQHRNHGSRHEGHHDDYEHHDDDEHDRRGKFPDRDD